MIFCKKSPIFVFMLTKTWAIVLRTIKYGERRMITEMFTRSSGRISFAVSVSRSSYGGLRRQMLQPLTLLDIECDIRPHIPLQKLRDTRLAVPYVSLPSDPVKISISLFISEFLCHALRGEQHNEQLFDYIADSLCWLDNSASGHANFHIVFLMRMSLFLGFYPNLDCYTPGSWFDLRAGSFTATHPSHHDVIEPADAARISVMMRMRFATMHLYRMSRDERNRTLDIIIRYYRIHIPDFPELRSLDVLHELFDGI